MKTVRFASWNANLGKRSGTRGNTRHVFLVSGLLFDLVTGVIDLKAP
jgi:hypothetical protein